MLAFWLRNTLSLTTSNCSHRRRPSSTNLCTQGSTGYKILSRGISDVRAESTFRIKHHTWVERQLVSQLHARNVCGDKIEYLQSLLKRNPMPFCAHRQPLCNFPPKRSLPQQNRVTIFQQKYMRSPCTVYSKYTNKATTHAFSTFLHTHALSTFLHSRCLSADFAVIPLFAIGEVLLIRCRNLLHRTDVWSETGKMR